MTTTYRRYDPRLKNLVGKSGNIDRFKQYGIPASSLRQWVKDGPKEFFTLPEFEMDSSSLVRETLALKSQIEVLRAKHELLSKTIKIFGFQIQFRALSLSWLGKKTGDIVASASTWSRVIRDLGLKRNRLRVYPPKPKIGIRASAPGQIWHLDLTILRLQDGTRAFVQAIIDNYSRYVLAWKVSKDYGGVRTKDLIHEALLMAQSLGLRMVPDVLVDSGTENLNTHVDELVTSELIRRTVAQIDIEASNSMIEMLFHRLKHRHLFQIPLTNFEALEKGAEYYFTQSNSYIPHAALKGATPEEIVTGKWTHEMIAVMRERVISARTARIESNRNGRCTPCLA